MISLGRKQILWLVYGAIALACLIAFSVAAVWASQGVLSTEITEILSAEVTIDTETEKTPETTRTEYIVGEPLDTTGAAIKVVTKEGKTVTPSLDECTVEADMDSAGVKPVVISWQEGTILYRGSYEIEVFAVRHLDVRPNDGDEKIVYAQDATELDKTGIEVWADLTGSPATMEKPSEWDNVVRLTPRQFTLTSSEMGTPGIHTATITAGRATGAFTFAVEGISIDTSQAATYYGVGEEFYPAGVNVMRISAADVTAANPYGVTYVGDYDYDPVDTSSAGSKAVKVSYEGVSAEYPITVYPVAFRTENVRGTDDTSATMDFYWIKGATTANEGGFKVTWVDANGVRHKQQGTWGYYDGNNVTMWAYNGLIDVCRIYFNENYNLWSWDVNDKHSWGPSDGENFEILYPYAKVGDFTLEIYGKAKLSDLEGVKHGVDAKSISVDTSEAKTVYESGETFSASGLQVTAQLWNGGTRVLDPSEYTVSAPALNAIGPKTVTVSYGNPTEGNPYQVLTVRYDIFVTGETLDVSGGKTVYFVGDDFSAAGIKLIRWDEEGGQTDVATEFTVEEMPDMSAAGTKTITLVSGEARYTYTIAVLPVPASPLEDSVLTFDNRTGDGNALALYIHERNSTTDADPASANGYYVYTMPASGSKMFSFGYTYDPAGWVSTFTSDESSLTASVLNDQASADNGALFVSYAGAQFTAPQTEWHKVVMHWAREFDYLEVDYSKATREYLVGGIFSAANLTVSLKYTDGTRQTLQEGEYTVSQPDMSFIGVHDITVSYKEDPEITETYQIFTIPDVPWETHKIDFTQSAAGDRLELYVIERPESSDSSQDSVSKGWFLLKAADGHYEMYELTYTYTAEGALSTFDTSAGISVRVGDGGELIATLGGTDYAVGAAMWHQRLIGWAA